MLKIGIEDSKLNRLSDDGVSKKVSCALNGAGSFEGVAGE